MAEEQLRHYSRMAKLATKRRKEGLPAFCIVPDRDVQHASKRAQREEANMMGCEALVPGVIDGDLDEVLQTMASAHYARGKREAREERQRAAELHEFSKMVAAQVMAEMNVPFYSAQPHSICGIPGEGQLGAQVACIEQSWAPAVNDAI
eukprot:7967180-Lingulodinium_polyedra.AAC.1